MGGKTMGTTEEHENASRTVLTLVWVTRREHSEA